MDNQTTTTTQVTTIVATYNVCSTFFIPTWMKCEDMDFYDIRYDRLYVTMKDGKEYIIEARWSAHEADFKHPDEEEKGLEELDEDEVEDMNDLCSEGSW